MSARQIRVEVSAPPVYYVIPLDEVLLPGDPPEPTLAELAAILKSRDSAYSFVSDLDIAPEYEVFVSYPDGGAGIEPWGDR